MNLSGKKYALNSGIEAWVQLGNLEKGGGAKMMLKGVWAVFFLQNIALALVL